MNKFIYTIQWKNTDSMPALLKVYANKENAEADLSTLKYKEDAEIVRWKKVIEEDKFNHAIICVKKGERC